MTKLAGHQTSFVFCSARGLQYVASIHNPQSSTSLRQYHVLPYIPLHMMLDEEFKLVVSAALHALLQFGRLSLPISSMDLLTRVITSKFPVGLLPDGTPSRRLRLTDLSRFESVLEVLSHTWDAGTLLLSRDEEGLSVIDAHLDNGVSSSGSGDGLNSRKRKRVVDEDADSAAGDDDAEEQADIASLASSSTLGSLSKELKEVYAILQRSTAKGRLLAEQVDFKVNSFR